MKLMRTLVVVVALVLSAASSRSTTPPQEPTAPAPPAARRESAQDITTEDCRNFAMAGLGEFDRRIDSWVSRVVALVPKSALERDDKEIACASVNTTGRELWYEGVSLRYAFALFAEAYPIARTWPERYAYWNRALKRGDKLIRTYWQYCEGHL